jgi:hypothetical protein
MNTLSKEKRSQLILVALLTLAALAGLWFSLISAQQRNLRNLGQKHSAAEQKLESIKKAIQTAPTIEAELTAKRGMLAGLEEGMASGDLYSWAVDTIREFKQNYKVEVPQFSQVEGPRRLDLLPQFPYKQASITISGTGPFYELGKFFSDLENKYPFVRLVNLTLEPAPNMQPADPERLAFKLDVVALVKPSNS